MRKIDYLTTTALTPVNYEPYTEHGGGGFKKVVSVVAAVVIPFAAPAIAASIGLSTAIGSAAASAVVGAGLGAVKGAVLGEDVGRAALLGGIGGGIAGYANPGVSATGVPNQPFSGTMFRPDAYNQATANFVPPGGNIGTSTANNQSVVSNNISTAPGDQFTVDAQGNLVNVTKQQTLAPETLVDASGTTAGDVAARLSENVGSGLSGNQAYTLDQLAKFKQTSGGVFANTGAKIVERFSDPDRLADVAIMSSINLLGSTIVGAPEMTPEEKEILEIQKEQLEKLKERDETAYNNAMAQARRYLGLAEDYDPAIVARQNYQTAMNRAGVARRNALREINPQNTGLLAAEKRRFDLGAAANAGSAYDKGMIMGLNTQSNLYDRALNAFPSGSSGNISSALTGLQQSYANLAKKRSDAQAGLNQMFGGFLTNSGDGNNNFRMGYRNAFADIYGTNRNRSLS